MIGKLFILSALVLASAVSGKTDTCATSIEQAPRIECLRLGMLVNDLIQVLPQESVAPLLSAVEGARRENWTRASAGSVVRFEGGYAKNPNQPKFSAVVTVLKDQVTSMRVYYNKPIWPSTDGFVEYLRNQPSSRE